MRYCGNMISVLLEYWLREIFTPAEWKNKKSHNLTPKQVVVFFAEAGYGIDYIGRKTICFNSKTDERLAGGN